MGSKPGTLLLFIFPNNTYLWCLLRGGGGGGGRSKSLFTIFFNVPTKNKQFCFPNLFLKKFPPPNPQHFMVSDQLSRRVTPAVPKTGLQTPVFFGTSLFGFWSSRFPTQCHFVFPLNREGRGAMLTPLNPWKKKPHPVATPIFFPPKGAPQSCPPPLLTNFFLVFLRPCDGKWGE